MQNQVPPRVRFYAAPMSALRKVLISRMAKPEEVLVTEDDTGQFIRERARDTDSITLYKSMREVLVYLTNLDPADMQDTMLSQLAKQVDESEWDHNTLNKLCWAIGSISGALTETQERSFLVRVIRDLLSLCENKRGKEHKAVVASNIM